MSINYEKWRRGLTEVARELINEIPLDKLSYAKPCWIYDSLESMGFKKSPTMRTTVCKLLMKAKNKQLNTPTPTVSDFPRHKLFLAQQKIAEAFILLDHNEEMLLEETSRIIFLAKMVKQKNTTVVQEDNDVQTPDFSFREQIKQLVDQMTPEGLTSTTAKLICSELGFENNQNAYNYTKDFLYRKRKKIAQLK